jgi:hypothetical protein
MNAAATPSVAAGSAFGSGLWGSGAATAPSSRAAIAAIAFQLNFGEAHCPTPKFRVQCQLSRSGTELAL